MHRHTRVLQIAAGLLLAVGLLWAGAVWLRPLAGLMPMTRQLLDTTEEILAESRNLQREMEAVQANVKLIQRQELLLAEQEALTRKLVSELNRQGELGRAATQGLTGILQIEQRTLALSQQVEAAAAGTVGSVRTAAQLLNSMGEATAQVEASSLSMDRQMDQMLFELQRSADTFAIITRIKSAPSQVAENYRGWWERVKGLFRW